MSLAIAAALLLVLELVRVTQVAPDLASALQRFMGRFVDARDGGTVYTTHLALLLGLAGPIWLGCYLGWHQAPLLVGDAVNAALDNAVGAQQRETETGVGRLREGVGSMAFTWRLVCSAGLVSAGVGDTAAAVVGRLFGRRTLHAGTSKTWEGTVASAVAMLLALALIMGPCVSGGGAHWGYVALLVLDVLGAAALEAVTDQLDNLVLPLWLTTVFVAHSMGALSGFLS